MKRWKSLGLRANVYIDDSICASNTATDCASHSQLTRSDLNNAGSVVNLEKSMLVPNQEGSWLGFLIDLRQGQFFVPPHKIQKLSNAITSIRVHNRVAVRLLASIVGQAISMGLALGPITRLRTRALYDLINQRWSWYDSLYLTTEAKEELEFWKVSIPKFNGNPIWFSPGCTRIAYSDASGTGFGGYYVELGNDVSTGLWSPDEAVLSSTWRELKAIFNVLSSFASKLAGHKVKWFTDNQGVVTIITKGSRKPHLQDGAVSIFEMCMRHAIKLEMEWLPRSENEKADLISRIVDYDDWKVDPLTFSYYNSLWGQGVVTIITKGSRKPHLQDGAVSIFEMCMRHAIKLEMEWLPRSENEKADLISRIVDYDDWKVDPLTFSYYNSLWGPHSVDCFATNYNSQLPRFFSRFWCPDSSAVDAFTVSWKDEVCWWAPPLHLVGHTTRICSSRGTLVLPAWKSAPFWPLICPDGVHLAGFIHCWDYVAPYEGLFQPGFSGNNIGDSLTTDMFLFVDFSIPPRTVRSGFCTNIQTDVCDVCSLP